MLLEFVADFLSENLANIPFGKMYAKPPKITEYVNSRLANIKKTSPAKMTMNVSNNNTLLTIARFLINSSIPIFRTNPKSPPSTTNRLCRYIVPPPPRSPRVEKV